jgi:hypothetical protein
MSWIKMDYNNLPDVVDGINLDNLDELTPEELDLVSGGVTCSCATPKTVSTLNCPPGYVCSGYPSQCRRAL